MQSKQEPITHTPLPWKAARFEQGVFTSANGRIVLQVLSNGPAAEVLANIDYVDRAVNNHDVLIKGIIYLTPARKYETIRASKRVARATNSDNPKPQPD